MATPPVSPDVARARFAAWVERVLREARWRGLTDKTIAAATGVSASTFHQWQSGEGGLPKLDRVIRFASGLEVPVVEALRALGLDDARQPTPPPPLDPELALIARRLADPRTSADEATAIRAVLRLLTRPVPAGQADSVG